MQGNSRGKDRDPTSSEDNSQKYGNALASASNFIVQRTTETESQALKRGRVDAAICSLLFMAGLRRSEVSSLRWSDIQEGENGTLLVQVRDSKTNQEGELDLRLLKNGATQAVRELREAVNPTAEDPVIGLNADSINNRFKAACRFAGVEGKLTAHSGRIGLASELITRGANTGSVALAGGWKSEAMVLHYSKRARVERGAVAQYF